MTPSTFKAACIQVSARADIAHNLEMLAPHVRAAVAAGAQLVVTPENVAFMSQDQEKIQAQAHPETRHPAVAAFAAMARENGVWLLAGSLHIKQHEGNRPNLANRSLLFTPQGTIAARYDKIHMFDANLGGKEVYAESATYQPGTQAVVATTPWGRIGLSICYDVRFAHLYRTLAQAGAFLFMVPAAFTRPTGQAHWRVLLRSRAIECGCYVLAPAQCGVHEGGRETHGHSMIIDPWGRVLAEAEDKPGHIIAEIDPHQVNKVRTMVPALHNDRSFSAPVEGQ